MNLLKVCMFGFAETDEGGRAWMIRKGLEDNGVEIVPCRTSVQGMWAKYRDLYRTWKKEVKNVDAVYVVFLGYYLMPLAWYLTRYPRAPLVLDAFISLYDTEVHDRKRVSPRSLHAVWLWLVDWLACALADAIVVDTRAHKEYFAKRYFVRRDKIIVVPIGCRTDIFRPLPAHKTGSEFVVEFHGRFIPLQGIEHILRAAKILEDGRAGVRFELLGDGQTYPEMRALAAELKVTSVHFLGSKTHAEVAEAIARADVCLGIFGTSDKALRVIPNKVYECLSSGKPVITERSPAALEYLRDGEEVRMVEPGDAHDLAAKILELKNNPKLRDHLRQEARAISGTIFSTRAIVSNLVRWIQSRA